jgi:hypothetical protein
VGFGAVAPFKQKNILFAKTQEPIGKKYNQPKEGLMKIITTTAALVTALTLLAACGESTGDRALSGGAIGAGVGAVTGAVVGGSPGTGAVIGGAVGAAAGGLTKKKDVDFGKPIWR